MSVVAVITVYECNGCGATVRLETDAEERTFKATWYEGLLVDFCPVCRELPAAKLSILADTSRRSHAAVVVTRVNTQQEVFSHANGH